MSNEPVQGIKGFDSTMSCRGFKFEFGKTYEVSGEIIACNSGYSGAATASGDSGAAMSTGWGGSVQGKAGCALFAVERDDEMKIRSVACGIVGSGDIKADTWYRCKDGRLEVVQ